MKIEKRETGNAAQQEAIRHKDGAMMVLAGPGSGKTFTIVQRLIHMICVYGIPPEEILVITFTKAAAMEMQERFWRETEGDFGVSFGTFHAVFFHILQEAYHYKTENILRETDKHYYIRTILAGMEGMREDAAFLEHLLSMISRIKCAGGTAEAFEGCSCLVEPEMLRFIYRAYDEAVSDDHRLDFDDMVLKCRSLLNERADVRKIWQEKYRYILVDEFQDISPAQYEVLRMLAEPRRNLFIVGDDDQSIYGFRGANPQIMLDFPKDYPEAKIVTLSVNYRSVRMITETAQRLVKHNSTRYAKNLRAENRSAGGVCRIAFTSKEEEGEGVVRLIERARSCMRYQDMAMLFRTNHAAGHYSRILMRAGIPFYLKDKAKNIFTEAEGQDILAMLSYAHGDHRRNHLLRFMNKPPRYIRRSLLTEEVIGLGTLLEAKDINTKVVQNIRKLSEDLERIREMEPYAAVNYIRKGMGYERWLMEEAGRKGKDKEEVKEILDEISAAAKEAGSYEEWLEEIDNYEKCMDLAEKAKDKDAVQLMTMHASKGLEFRMVILTDVNERNIPQKKADSKELLEEERRLFYVALTRAKEKLCLLYLAKNMEKRIFPSRFLREME